MSKNEESKHSIELTAVIGLGSGIYAYFTTPSLIGLKGIFAATMVGSGTGLGAGIAGGVGMVAGGAIGAAISSLRERSSHAATILLGVAGLFSGAVAGTAYTYPEAKEIVVKGMETINAVNNNTPKAPSPKPVK